MPDPVAMGLNAKAHHGLWEGEGEERGGGVQKLVKQPQERQKGEMEVVHGGVTQEKVQGAARKKVKEVQKEIEEEHTRRFGPLIAEHERYMGRDSLAPPPRPLCLPSCSTEGLQCMTP